MLWSLENLLGYQIDATNGYVGTLEDLLYLDDTWTIRYLVVAAGGWLNRKEVLLSTQVIREISYSGREISVRLTKERVYMSPDVDTDKPVTRQKEFLLAEHYGWGRYWKPETKLGRDLLPERLNIEECLPGSNPHLRSFREVTTYRMLGDAPPRGFITDAIADDLNWRIPSLVVSKSRERALDAVLVPTERVCKIDWEKRLIQSSIDSEDLGAFPPFVPTAAVNERRVVKFFDYYGRLHRSAMIPECEERS